MFIRLTFYHLADEIWWKKYLSSYYFVCITMNTVGYGDIVAQNNLEKIFCIFFIYIACGLFAYTLNVVGNILQQINNKKSQFIKNIMVINEYLNKKNINYDLRMRIRKYLEYVWEEELFHNNEEENSIMDKLSSSLKEELLLETNGRILQEISFLVNNFSEETLRKLIFKLRELHFMPGDIIYQKGDSSNNSLYIVWKGEVELYMELYKKEESHQIIQKILQGKTLGEKEFIIGGERKVSAKSSSFSTVFELKYSDFIGTLAENTEDYHKYMEIKDKGVLYDNFSEVQLLSCYYCQDPHHSVTECPFLHLQLLNQRVILKYCSYKPNERQPFARRKMKKFCALKKQKLCEFVSKTVLSEQMYSELGSSDNQEQAVITEREIELMNDFAEKKKTVNNVSECEEIQEEVESSDNFVLNVNNNSDVPFTTFIEKETLKIPEKKTVSDIPFTSSDYTNFQSVNKQTYDDSSFKIYESINKVRSAQKLRSSLNLKKIGSQNIAREEKEINKTEFLLLFDKQMDFENYFPHNNSHNVVMLYNLLLDQWRCHKSSANSPSKFRKGRLRKGILPNKDKERRTCSFNMFESSISLKIEKTEKIEKRKSIKNYKSRFFKFDHEKNDNLDREGVIKLLKLRKKERMKKNWLIRIITFCLNLLREKGF